MAKTASTMLELGTPAPDFKLSDPSGNRHGLNDFAGSPLLVAFICNHCPYVKHIRHELARVGKECRDKHVGVVAINSNDVANYPEDSPENMAQEASSAGYTFPYLYDESQEVAKAYKAACTPDFFLFDSGHKLVYRGQFDESRPENGRPVTGKDLRAAIEKVVAGQPVPEKQTPSLGCNIKWKRGNEPGYF